MFELSISTSFAAAHRLDNYQGKCEALHGHNWKVEVTVKAEHLNDIGIAIDFKDLKAITNRILDGLDHTCLNDIYPFTEINPSSENIAKYLYEELEKQLTDFPVTVEKTSVWESDNAWAVYYR